MVDYHFVSSEEYRRLQDSGELLESANVYGNWYGVPKAPVRLSLEQGKDVIIKVDVQGAATMRQITPQAVFIFLVAPSMDELAARLQQRLTESAGDLALRLQTAEEEMKQMSHFDYVVENRQVKEAVSLVQAIITAEKCRVNQRRIILP
jgi:guanylate kinase